MLVLTTSNILCSFSNYRIYFYFTLSNAMPFISRLYWLEHCQIVWCTGYRFLLYRCW